MASTESGEGRGPQVVRLAAPPAAQLAMLQQLVVDSGWNQTPADWSLFLRKGAVYAVHDARARIVASGAVLPMGPSLPPGSACAATGVAWISMILVTPAQRGAGLGRAVFERCLRHVQADGRIAMLDATPAGEALYAKFGFTPLWRLARWRREAMPRQAAPGPAAAAQGAPAFDRLATLDAQALGFMRTGLLADLVGRPGCACIERAGAVAVVRPGRSARHVGPLLGADEVAAAQLLHEIAGAEPGPLLVDVPDDRPLLHRALEAAGFRRERPFARMALVAPGQLPPTGRTQLIHAVAGPEYA